MKKNILAYNAYTLNKPITGVGRYTQMLSYIDNNLFYKVGLCYNSEYCWNHGFNELINSNIKSKLGKLYWNFFSYDLRNKFEILHSPFPSLPYFRKKKSIITVHDLIFLSNPEWYSRKELAFIIHALKHSVKSADHIICVSNSTKIELLNHFPSAESKTTVIHNCFSYKNKFQLLNKFIPSNSILSTFLQKKFNYFVCPSNRHPRKNLNNTIKGFLNSKLNIDGFKLVLTGLNENNSYSKHKSIIDLGYLSDEEYYCLINNSQGIIYFPFKEGFGLPILDALMFDKNIFISDLSVFREILPHHDMLNNPASSSSVTDYLDFMYNSIGKKISFKKEEFSFKKFEKSHIKIYDKIINEN